MIIIPPMSPSTYPYPNCMFFFINPLNPVSAVHMCKDVGPSTGAWDFYQQPAYPIFLFSITVQLYSTV